MAVVEGNVAAGDAWTSGGRRAYEVLRVGRDREYGTMGTVKVKLLFYYQMLNWSESVSK